MAKDKKQAINDKISDLIESLKGQKDFEVSKKVMERIVKLQKQRKELELI